MPRPPKFETCDFCFPDRKRIIFESKSFYALLSLGPVTEGHSLLNSKGHYPCCSAIEEREEWLRAKENLVSRVSEQYGQCILFEHGRAGACVERSEGGEHERTLCFHAHLHIVPASVDLIDDLGTYGRPFYCQSWDEVVDFGRAHENYIFYEDRRGRMTVLEVGTLPQYFLRWLVASKLGVPEKASWRQYRGDEFIRAALTKLQPTALLI